MNNLKRRVIINKRYVQFIDPVKNPAVHYYLMTLVDDTWKDHRTRIGADAKGLSHTNIKVKGIYHIDNRELFDLYEVSHQEAAMRYIIPDALIERPIKTRYRDNQSSDSNALNNERNEEIESQVPFLTTKRREIRPLQTTEAYLFHGTDIDNINAIIKTGFKMGKAARGLYGHPGIYLAESSQKADQYADAETNRCYMAISPK